MNEQLYYIWWKATTGDTGHGTGAYPKDEAQMYCDRMNEKDRDINLVHWIEPVPEQEGGENGTENA